MGLLTTTAKAARKLADEWDEAAWLKENPQPDVPYTDPSRQKHRSAKSSAKRRANKDGYDSMGRKIEVENPELDAWLKENPNPVEGLRYKDHTPEQRKLYANWHKRKERFIDPEKFKARETEQYQKHRDKKVARQQEYNEQNRGAINERQREYYSENKEQAIANNAKRRAAQLDRTPDYSNDEAIKRVYEQAGLLSEATGTPHHVDHVIPLQGENVSGLHVPGNLMITPSDLNLSKSNKFAPGADPMQFNDVAQRNIDQANEMGLIGHLAKNSDVEGLVNRGYPESVARRIASGELPMDEASRLARAEAQGYGPLIFRGQRNKIPLEGDQDIWASSSRDVAQTYADSFQEYGGGSVIPVRTDASNLADVNARGKGWRSVETNNRKVPGIETGVHKGTDRISEAVRDSDQYDGTLFRNINDEAVKVSGEKADTYNVLGSRDDVNIRHENAAYDPEYSGNNIMGFAQSAGNAGQNSVSGFLSNTSSIEETMGQAASEGLESLGMDPETAAFWGPIAAIAPQFVPLVGAGVGIDNTVRALDKGNYGEAALEAGLTVLGEVPIFGDLAAKGIKAAIGRGGDAAEELPNGVLGITGEKVTTRKVGEEIPTEVYDPLKVGKGGVETPYSQNPVLADIDLDGPRPDNIASGQWKKKQRQMEDPVIRAREEARPAGGMAVGTDNLEAELISYEDLAR